ncbi:XRE family transcriptional regulator [Listeria monocytogenes]|nr:XRE family transcriptional regulator [Listeria monocytogenes]EAF0976868.1 XRE family transcriptional regulator [Listeria monocytogenes]EAG4028505.1 XRE family transcriptional regulator [Listeria monocytogenes]EAG4040959.1 XRE family transcriptional regulator [Listeria monocytogenes]EIY6212064.1 helix-turn-helix transcriptional regulator [Listeria monocytogenes]
MPNNQRLKRIAELGNVSLKELLNEPSSQKKDIGARIRKIRKSLGLSMEEFGIKVDKALKSNVSKWERGDSLPNNSRIKIIAELGGISVDELLNGTSAKIEKLYSQSEHVHFQIYNASEKEAREFVSNIGEPKYDEHNGTQWFEATNGKIEATAFLKGDD